MYMYAYIIFKVEYQMVDVKSNSRSISWWKEVRDNSVLQMHCGRSRLLTQQLNGIDREVQWMPRDRRIPRSTEQNAIRMMMLIHVCRWIASRGTAIMNKLSLSIWQKVYAWNAQLSSSLMKKCTSICIRTWYTRAKAVSLEEQALLHLVRDFRKREDCWK